MIAPPASIYEEVFLDRFVHLRDEDAFASLVVRHGGSTPTWRGRPVF